MTGEVLGGVLPFSIRKVSRRAMDPCSLLLGVFVVGIDVWYAYHQVVARHSLFMRAAPANGA